MRHKTRKNRSNKRGGKYKKRISAAATLAALGLAAHHLYKKKK